MTNVRAVKEPGKPGHLAADSLGPSPGALRYPEHRVDIKAAPGTWRARLGDTELARSDHAWCVSESGYPDVIYFPRESVHLDRLNSSQSETTCPFKGRAGYYAAQVGGQLRDIAWFYPRTYREVEQLADHIAFYTHSVTIERENDHEPGC